MSWRRFIQLLIGALLLILLGLIGVYLWVIPNRGAGVVRAQGSSDDQQWRFLFALYGPGVGSAPWFSRPLGISSDGTRIYVTDTENGRVCVFDDRGRFLRHVGTPGLRFSQGRPNPAWRAGQLAWPSDSAATADGTIWVADTVNRCIQRFTPDGTATIVLPVNTASAPGQAGHASLLDRPLSVTVAENSLYVADGFRVSRYSLDGRPKGFYGQQKGGFKEGALHSPWGIIVDESGNVAVADSLNHRVQAYSAGGKLLWVARGALPSGKASDAAELFALPRGMDRDSAGHLYVADPLKGTIIVLSAQGKKLAELGETGRAPGRLLFPNDVAVTRSGTVFVADRGNSRVEAFRLNIRLPE